MRLLAQHISFCFLFLLSLVSCQTTNNISASDPSNIASNTEEASTLSASTSQDNISVNNKHTHRSNVLDLPNFQHVFNLVHRSIPVAFPICQSLFNTQKQVAEVFEEKAFNQEELCTLLKSDNQSNIVQNLIQHYQALNQTTSNHIQKQEISFIKAFLKSLPGEQNRLITQPVVKQNIDLGVITHPDGSGKILFVEKNSTADLYAIQPGDVIIEVDGKKVSTMGTNDVLANALLGPPNSKLTLVLKTPKRFRRITMIRQSIPESSVSTEWLSSTSLYLKITSISQHTVSEIREKLTDILFSADTLPVEVVIDLRSCHTGQTIDAVDIANLFLENDIILGGQKKNNQKPIAVIAKKGLFLPGTYYSVLIDQGTQGPAEILASAIQDSERGDIIGSRTLGQTFITSRFATQNPQWIIEIATAVLYRAKGSPLSEGIIPDICISPLDENGVCSASDLSNISPLLMLRLNR